jgi:two-component system, chemotaxis family, chemotaxis protein CheY
MKSILIIDDSRVARLIMRKILGNIQPEWPVHEAGGGEEALALAKEISIDIALVDQHMPGMEGFEVAEALKQAYPGIMISMVTADIQEAMRKRAEEMDVHFIPKPAAEDAVMAFLKKVVETAA